MNQKIYFFLAIIVLLFNTIGCAQNQTNKVILSEDYKRHFDKYAVKGSLVIYDLKDDKTFYYDEERTQIQFTPASTFKIFNSLVGLETGIIPDTSFVIQWDGVKRGSYVPWHRANSLKSAFQYSVVWYYQDLARRVGKKEMQRLVSLNGYGNENISDEIDSFWLGGKEGKMKISQEEQIQFLKKLYKEELKFSKRSQKLVKEIMLSEENGEYRLFAKTGSGEQDGLWYGWYVGWIEKGNNAYFFATNFETEDYRNVQTGGRKGITIAVLKDLGFLNQTHSPQDKIQVGAANLEAYLPLLNSKKVGMVVNHTTTIGKTHVVDTLLSRGVDIGGIYAPEHGYRGTTERGKMVEHQIDESTGIQIHSIYGSKRKPSPDMLKGIELMIFDMQDVGARFFTYISTLHNIMEACAENNIKVLILDRPNPLGYYVDGPILDASSRSFIGMHTIPIVHGMTIGEYAQMINGEKWLKNGIQCELEIIKVENYTHQSFYEITIPPSPNLPDMKSIYLYPSICLFEGTKVSEGRGTMKPFQQFGTPTYTPQKDPFVPKPIPAMSTDPKFDGKTCYGYDLSGLSIEELRKIQSIDLSYLIEFYQKEKDKAHFFENSFDLLAGSDQLRKQIIEGKTEDEIKESWQPGLQKFKEIRKKYLLYEE